MADTKISALTAATTPLAGTEVLPIVQSGVTKQVSIANLTAGRDVSTNSVAVAAGVPVYLNGTSGNTQILYYASLVIDMQINGTKGFRVYAPGAGTSELRGDWAVNSTGGGSGNLTMSNGNIIQGTAAKGINFTANTPAAGMTSQLLNWYEEGTWTVTLYDAATGGNASATTVTGYYTRIGRQVTATFSGLNSIDTTGMTAGNSLYISLPFSASSIGGATGSIITRSISFAGFNYVTPYVANSANRALIRKIVSAGNDFTVAVSDLTSGSARLFYFTLTYFV